MSTTAERGSSHQTSETNSEHEGTLDQIVDNETFLDHFEHFIDDYAEVQEEPGSKSEFLERIGELLDAKYNLRSIDQIQTIVDKYASIENVPVRLEEISPE